MSDSIDTVISRPDPSGLREQLERLIAADLLGPAGGPEEEVDEARVTERYIVGMLAPGRTRSRAEQEDALGVHGGAPTEEGEAESETPAQPSLFPSAYGLTCVVDGRTEQLDVTASWGRYERGESAAADDVGSARPVWHRIPRGGRLALELIEGRFEAVAPDPELPEVVVEGRVRRRGDRWVVTVFLVNRQQERDRSRDQAWLFQAGFTLAAVDGSAVFLSRDRVRQTADGDGAEGRAMAMAYRHQPEFAVGHGVGVHAETAPGDVTRAVRVGTAVLPSHEVPPTTAPSLEEEPWLAGLVLDMQALADLPPPELAPALTPLVEAYRTWIAEQRVRVDSGEDLLGDYGDVARAALDTCAVAAGRIAAGIALLDDDPLAAEAFAFANRAMAAQRVHTLAAERRRREPDLAPTDALAAVDLPANRSWRPFQLAFVLLNLPSLTDPTHAERSDDPLVDLLWFPTGGGKTEAYLGLTAYVLSLRRLQGVVAGKRGADGVAVIMRYTLRLLTTQQFQRAAALLCACEHIRKDRLEAGDERWGSTPLRIGLWVGMRATPNTTEDAKRWVSQQRGATGWQRGTGGSPAQLTVCPWCGAEIRASRDIVVDTDRGRTILYCGDPTGRCSFTARNSPGEGLPVLVVDEEIYRHPPSLLIGTVDKFAQLPWRGPVQALFGVVTRHCERHGYLTPDEGDHASRHPRRGRLPAAVVQPATPLRPPDLIIQDELHLIAGPLGSMVGLYETVIDRLCTWQVNEHSVRPKVIASTATVRRARHQAHALFWRDLKVFPPPGLDAGDSFFARQREPGPASPGRRYLGVCAQGRRFKAVLIRVYVAQLAAAQTLYERYGTAADPYLTLVGYFNSLRELGGMRRLVDDDVASRLRQTDQRGLATRLLRRTEELTSRVGSGDIPRLLDHLGIRFDPDTDARPIDVLLATNMVSVGVDVPRLGAMVVAGQPKGTAEYIQATSRIGRQSPGLVLTVYNWARPRDLSHYETFEHYHATFAQHVEALSVTPFAPRALDRGLTALLVALVRQEQPEWNAEDAAKEVPINDEAVQRAVAAIRERAAGVSSRSALAGQVEVMLQARLDQWSAEQGVTGRGLAYRSTKGGTTAALLRPPGMEPWDAWTVLTSLRDVEPGVRLLLADGDLDDSAAPPYDFEKPQQDEADGAPSHSDVDDEGFVTW